MTAAFADLQRAYAEHKIATYPLREDKTPAVRGYGKVGLRGSEQLAIKFPLATACGFWAGPRNNKTLADVDSTDERLRDETLAKCGPTPLWVQTPSGGWHFLYRHSGEARRIRALPDVDILGSGNVVAAGSVVAKGKYQIVRGTLDDLARLPPMRPQDSRPARDVTVTDGKRNDTLFRCLLRQARFCDDFDSFLDVARTLNMECSPPMLDTEVVQIAKSAWGYEITGKNWVGRKARASTDREEILAFSRDPAAALLLNLLRVSHPMPDDRFAIDQVKVSALLGWDRGTLKTKIEALIAGRRLVRVHFGTGKHDPHLYQLIQGAECRAEKTTTI